MAIRIPSVELNMTAQILVISYFISVVCVTPRDWRFHFLNKCFKTIVVPFDVGSYLCLRILRIVTHRTVSSVRRLLQQSLINSTQ